MKPDQPDRFDHSLRENLSDVAPVEVHQRAEKHFESFATSMKQRESGSAISGRDRGNPLLIFAQTLWRELFWSGRRAWAGYAAVWLVIVLVNLADSDRSTPTEAKLKQLPAGMLMALREQERLLIDLMDQPEAKVAEPPKSSVPRPRSQRPVGWAAA